MTLPTAVVEALADVYGGAFPSVVTPCEGGMINRAARVEMPGSPVFVKWQEGTPPPGTFPAEARGLEELRRHAPEAIQIPRVIAVGETFLTMEYYPPARPVDLERFTTRFAEGLGTLHRLSAAPQHRYGFEQDTYLGFWLQPNGWQDDWVTFYRERRLLPQIETARTSGLLDADRERLLMSVVDRLDTLLDDLPDAAASLLHGDLWSGNFLCTAGDMPVLIDPAVYYGHREMEIAYIELFGGFPPGFVAAYERAFPLDTGYAYRRPLHQLYHLINHWNHFGEPYGRRVADVCHGLLG